MSFAAKFAEDVLSTYKAEQGNGDVELEIRFKGVDRDLFQKVYTAVAGSDLFGPPTLENSLNVISDSIAGNGVKGGQFIRKLVFAEGATETFVEKKTLKKSVQFPGYIPYIISLAVEKPIPKFVSASDALARFKSRISAEISGTPWRIDFTATLSDTVKGFGARIGSIRKEFFPPAMTAENYLETLRYDMVKGYEIELEYVGSAPPTSPDLSIVNTIYSVTNPGYAGEVSYQEEIYNVASKILTTSAAPFKSHTHRLKRLANQVSSLSKNTYYSDIFPPNGYFATEKADGVRAILSVLGSRVRVLRSDGMVEIGSTSTPATTTIVDCEVIGDTYYIFDAMVVADKNISSDGFEIRSGYLAEAAEIVTAALAGSGRAVAKRFVLLGDDLEAGFREVYEGKYDYTLDGIIITAPGKSYQQTVSYKWKPFDHNTIDFAAMKCPQGLLGNAPYMKKPAHTLYILFVGINRDDKEKLGLGFISNYKKIFPSSDPVYFPIQFSPSVAPYAYLYWHSDEIGGDLSGKIVELARNPAGTDWVFKGIRTDRAMEKNYYGNDYRIAEMTFMNYVDRFDFEDLWKQSESYFQSSGEGTYVAGNKLRRFVISCVLRDNFAGARWLLDLAAGRGADLHRYQELRVDNALFIEVDTTAVAELVRRKFSFIGRKRGGGVEPPFIKDTSGLTIHTMVADLKTNYSELIAGTYQYGVNQGGVDGVVCNFAIHYLCDSIGNMRNLLLFVSKMLKSGGIFMFSTMDGGKIFDLLGGVSTGGKWAAFDGEVMKYAIEKRYSGDKLAPAGQMIAVKLPFVDGLVEEPLCNVDVVIRECEKLGMNLELDVCMLDYLEKFAGVNPTLAGTLSEDDKKYTGLFRLVTVRMK